MGTRLKRAVCDAPHLNSRASSPHISGEVLIIEIGMTTASPFEILSIQHSLASASNICIKDIDVHIYSLNLVVEDPIAAHERLGEWDDVGLCGLSEGPVHGSVQPERFADDGVEVLEGVEIVH